MVLELKVKGSGLTLKFLSNFLLVAGVEARLAVAVVALRFRPPLPATASFLRGGPPGSNLLGPSAAGRLVWGSAGTAEPPEPERAGGCGSGSDCRFNTRAL